MGNAIIGATLLHLPHSTDTSIDQVTTLFPWRAGGSLLGNLMVAVLFDRVAPEAVLAFACLAICVCNAAVPW